VDYDPEITVLTPEGLELRQPLAGLGSRILAQLVDLLPRGLVLAAAVIVAVLIHGTAARIAVVAAGGFVALYAYDILFEVYADGRTPGKRAAGLRVLEADGTRIGWRASAVRNAMRLIDGPLTGFLAGTVSTVVTTRSQRVGDLAAGTVVVRERLPIEAREIAPEAGGDRDAELGPSDTAAVRDEEVAAVSDFLARREGLLPAARRRLAATLADGLRPRVAGGVLELEDAEQFLERLLAERRTRASAGP
jgi:uncharacterized RDD family membrane protein YckC